MATIQGVYVALFGRPADPTGLAYFNSVTSNGANLNAIGNLSSQAEYTARFSGMNNVQIINTIYQSLFGRDADLTGLTFFADALAKGTLTINNIAIAILDGAQGTDKTIVTNKVAAADLYTKALDTGSEVVAYSGLTAAAAGRTFLTGVKDTVPTAAAVDAAVLSMVNASVGGGTGTGSEFFLTSAAAGDIFGPNNATAANKTTTGNDTFTGRTAGDLQTADIIDGGDGNDTLTAAMALGAGTVAPLLKNIENINLNYGTGVVGDKLTGSPVFDAKDVTGATKITVGNVYTDDAANTITVNNVLKTTTVALKNITVDNGAAGSITGVATVSFKDVAGTSDAATISLEKVTLGAADLLRVDVGGIETLTVNSTGAANTAIIKDAELKSLVITGDQNVTLSHDAANVVIKTVDASALTGSLTYTASGNGETITGTAKADVITLGGGADTFVYTAATASKLAAFDEIKSFAAGTNTTAVDKIDFKALALGSDTSVGTTAVNVGGDIANFFSAISATTRIVFNETTSMLYVDANKDGSFTAGTDVAIKLTGVAAANLDKGDFILA